MSFLISCVKRTVKLILPWVYSSLGILKNIYLFGYAWSLLWHVGSSSLTRLPPHWEHGVLATGWPGSPSSLDLNTRIDLSNCHHNTGQLCHQSPPCSPFAAAPSLPQTLATMDLFPSPVVLSFRECHKNRSIQYVTLGDCFFHSAWFPGDFIQAVACISILLLFIAKK